MKYDKLIRDKIPEHLDAKKISYSIHESDAREYSLKLREKLQEEVNEFLQDNNIEELADIMEVVLALGKDLGVSSEEIEKVRVKKIEDRGGFEKKLILEQTGE